jgi:hypothetical protein
MHITFRRSCLSGDCPIYVFRSLCDRIAKDSLFPEIRRSLKGKLRAKLPVDCVVGVLDGLEPWEWYKPKK